MWSALQNSTGIANSIAVIGPKAVFSGAFEWIGKPRDMAAKVDEIYSKSEFMKTRYLTMNRDIATFKAHLEQQTGNVPFDKAYSAYRDGGFWMMVRMQQLVDVPTWLGAYNAAKADTTISEENAVALADQAVIDAQGGGRTVDMSQFMRGKGFARVWTVYAGYFNVVYMRTIEAFQRAGVNNYTPASVGRMVTDLLFLWTAPVMLTVMLKEAIAAAVGGDDEDDEIALKLAKEQISYLLAMFPLAREASAGLLGFGNYNGPVGARFFKELNDFSRQAMQGEADEQFYKELASASGFFIGLPTAQIMKTYDGFQAMEKNNATPVSLIFGPPKN